MPRPTSHALVLLSLWLLTACRTAPNPEYCDAENDRCATMPGGDWTCDLDMNRCIPPSGAACTDNGDCMRPAEPICDVAADPAICRGCTSGTECEALNPDTPICSNNGECIDGCRNIVDCSRANPICDTNTGVCGPCTGTGPDDTCMARDDGANYCNGSSCVECLDNTQCSETAPICDGTNTCAVCKEHSDCATYSGVCGDNGACVPESQVVYVKKGSLDTNDCSKATPCLTLTRARDAVLADAANKKYIRILDGESYAGNFTLTGIAVSIIGIANTRITAIEDNQPAIDVTATADVTLESLSITSVGANADGIRCQSSNSSVRLENVIVQNNSGFGINISTCEITVERSIIGGNDSGGVTITGAAFDITNSFIAGNGSGTSEVGGVLIVNGTAKTPQRFAFNTVAQNVVGTTAAAASVACTASGTVIASGNILRKDGASKDSVSGSCVWDHSNIEGKATIPGNIAAAETNIDADCSLTNEAGVLRITAGTPCDNAAAPVEGVTIDFDGDDRSAETPDMGADELAP